MPRVKTTPPAQTREKGQRSLSVPEGFYRVLPLWQQPKWYDAEMWRSIVARQPFALSCRETLISSYLALDWSIEARDSNMRDELKPMRDYYTKFLKYTGEYDYTETVEWIGKDLLDIPFGGAAELIREGDTRNGNILSLLPLDGGTLFPTLSKDYPVGQALKSAVNKPVYFPRHAIDRVYISPRTEIKRFGWGMPPPEKIYLAIEMLNRGDVYYANLLLDTPETGILDLLNMSKESAEEWVKAFRDLMGGIDPQKIPVLYEHDKPAVFIPFGRPPTEMMFDRVTLRYGAIVTAGYGMTLSDIGIQAVSSGGETLAGTIRNERQTRRSGFARFKRKMKSFFDFILPESLEYMIIDQDDELSIAMGRARLANSTAFNQLIQMGVFTPEEVRKQMIADGLMSISLPEEIPESDVLPPQTNQPPERPGMLGKPISPSQGGYGEVKSDAFSETLKSLVDVKDVSLRKLVRAGLEPVYIETLNALSEFQNSELEFWNEWHDEVLWGNLIEDIPEFTLNSINSADGKIRKALENDIWWKLNFGDEFIDEMKELFRAACISKAKSGYEMYYERNEINEMTLDEIITTLDKEFEDESLQAKFLEELNKMLDELKRKLPDVLSKSVISGIRRGILFVETAKEIADDLDMTQILGNNVIIDYIRSELINLRNKLTREFANNLEEKIKILLEDVKCPLPQQVRNVEDPQR